LECDFLTVDTLFLKRSYVLFFIELATRRVRLARITTNPDGRRGDVPAKWLQPRRPPADGRADLPTPALPSVAACLT